GTLDPVLEYAVPDKVTALVAAVVDAQGRGGPGGVYRLAVEPQQSAARSADFRLLTTGPVPALPAGGRAVLPVLLERHGYTGPVEVTAAGLPAGVTLENTAIPPEADGTLITLRRGAAAAGAAITTWHGRGADGQQRIALLKGHPLERLQPWLAEEIAVAPTTAKADELQIDWRGLPDDTGFVPTKKLALPIKLTRPADTSLVRLSL